MPQTNALDLTPFLAFGTEALLYGATLIFIVFSLVLLYHVRHYSLNKVRAMSLFTLYVAGGIVLLITMTAAFFAL